MVKGISKQVVLVRPQDDALFEQAIFIVKDGVREVTEKELLRQAGAAGSEKSGTFSWRTALLGFLGGGGAVGLSWLIYSLT